MEKLKKSKKRFLTKKDVATAYYNAFKSFIVLMFSNLIGYLLYFLILRGANEQNSQEAVVRTFAISIIVFVFSFFVYYQFLKLEKKSERVINETKTLKDAYKDSGYNLDFNSYFINILKKRLWGYYIAPVIIQIPLIINYLIVTLNPAEITIYDLEIYIYKWNVLELFAYEIFGNAWFLGFFLFMFLFSIVFTTLSYFYFKKLLVKPTYLN